MAAQLLPLLGALARSVVSSPFRAVGSFALVGRALSGGGSNQQQPFNLAALARQLGTPNPSQAQIQAAQQQQYAQSGAGLSAAGQHFGQGMAELSKFSIALAVTTKGVAALGKAANDRAAQELRIFSPQYAALAAEKERAGMQYAIQRGRDTSASARALGQSIMTSQREFQPYASAVEIFTNKLTKFAVDILIGAEGLLEKVGITGAVKRYVAEEDAKRQKGQDSLQHAIRGALQGRNAGPLNHRPNERPDSRM